MTVMFSLARAFAQRRKWSCLVHKPGQTHSPQPVQSVRYVRGQLCKRNIFYFSPGAEWSMRTKDPSLSWTGEEQNEFSFEMGAVMVNTINWTASGISQEINLGVCL